MRPAPIRLNLVATDQVSPGALPLLYAFLRALALRPQAVESGLVPDAQRIEEYGGD
jgi:DNA polymerase III psi subunit